MTSVNKLLKQALLQYPTLFPNRSRILHHVLCVIGNGYGWDENGEVRSESEAYTPWTPEMEAARNNERYAFHAMSDWLREASLASDKREMELCKKIVSEVEERILQTEPIQSFYPQSSYALIMNIPENVTDEWRAVCEEMRAVAEEAGWKFS